MSVEKTNRVTTHTCKRNEKGNSISDIHDFHENLDLTKADNGHIHPERFDLNCYLFFGDDGDCINAQFNEKNEMISYEKPASNTKAIRDHEMKIYEKHFRDHVSAQNEKYKAVGHEERCKTMLDYKLSGQTSPAASLLYVSNVNSERQPTREEMISIMIDYVKWHNEQFPQYKIYQASLHMDEDGAPHWHYRMIPIAHDKDGHEYNCQSKALEEMEIEPMDKSRLYYLTDEENAILNSLKGEDKKAYRMELGEAHRLPPDEKGERRYPGLVIRSPEGNLQYPRSCNAVTTFTELRRAKLIEIGKEHGFTIEETARDRAHQGRSMITYKQEQDAIKAMEAAYNKGFSEGIKNAEIESIKILDDADSKAGKMIAEADVMAMKMKKVAREQGFKEGEEAFKRSPEAKAEVIKEMAMIDYKAKRARIETKISILEMFKDSRFEEASDLCHDSRLGEVYEAHEQYCGLVHKLTLDGQTFVDGDTKKIQAEIIALQRGFRQIEEDHKKKEIGLSR